jgi:thymidylate kinase
VEYHRGVRENYLAQAAKEPSKVKVISAGGEKEVVHREILRVLESV